MKRTIFKLIATTCSVCLMFCFYFTGRIAGQDQEQAEIKSQILSNQHAPGPVEIGDSTYLVRYYSLN